MAAALEEIAARLGLRLDGSASEGSVGSIRVQLVERSGFVQVRCRASQPASFELLRREDRSEDSARTGDPEFDRKILIRGTKTAVLHRATRSLALDVIGTDRGTFTGGIVELFFEEGADLEHARLRIDRGCELAKALSVKKLLSSDLLREIADKDPIHEVRFRALKLLKDRGLTSAFRASGLPAISGENALLAHFARPVFRWLLSAIDAKNEDALLAAGAASMDPTIREVSLRGSVRSARERLAEIDRLENDRRTRISMTELDLIEQLTHEDTEKRIAAVISLGIVGTIRAIEPMREARRRTRMSRMDEAVAAAIERIRARSMEAAGKISIAAMDAGQLSRTDSGAVSIRDDDSKDS